MKKSGNYYLPDDDTYFHKFFKDGGEFEIGKLQNALEYVDKFDVAFDAGAHIGSWSIAMSHVFETVYAVEAAYDTHQCLLRNTSSRPNIFAYNRALMDEDGLYATVIDDNTRLGNTGSRYVRYNGGGVSTVKLDSFKLSALDFLKLDIEGSEILALRGAVNTIQAYKPVIYIEAKKGMGERFGSYLEEPLKFIENLGGRCIKKMGSDYVYKF